MSERDEQFDVVTVTLNPAIDQTVTIPGFTAGAVNRVSETRMTAGGKGVNVAAALADSGARVCATGFLGRDNITIFEELFAAKNIADLFVRIHGGTRVGIKVVDPERGQTTDINFPGTAPTSGDLSSLRAHLRSTRAKWYVLAGSLPPDVPIEIYRDLINDMRAAGSRVLLDASGLALRSALEAKPEIIKPNIHELEEYVGAALTTKDDVANAARSLIAGGVGTVVVSMGKEGACFVTAQEVVTARPPDVAVKSTVGAGDAMVAGILAGKLRELSLRDTARLATAFSLDVLTRAQPGLSSPDRIEELSRSVSCG